MEAHQQAAANGHAPFPAERVAQRKAHQKDPDGEVHVKQTGDHLGRKGLKIGGGVGLAVGLLAPPLLGATVVGAGSGGGWAGRQGGGGGGGGGGRGVGGGGGAGGLGAGGEAGQ